jgi:hypothetical protein
MDTVLTNVGRRLRFRRLSDDARKAPSKRGIGLSGAAGAGKDTAADAILAQGPFYVDHFAADLKRIARDYFGWDGKKDERGRKLLQLLGTEVGRAWYEGIWVEKYAGRNGLSIPAGGGWLDLAPAKVEEIAKATWLRAPTDFDMGAHAVSMAEAMFGWQVREGALTPAFRSLVRAFRAPTWTSDPRKKALILAMAEFGFRPRMLEPGHRLMDKARKLLQDICSLASEYDPKHWETARIDLVDVKAGQVLRAWGIHETWGRNGAMRVNRVGKKYLVCPDCRFPNEQELFRQNDCLTVQVVRPGVGRMEHASERSLDGAEYDATLDGHRKKPAGGGAGVGEDELRSLGGRNHGRPKNHSRIRRPRGRDRGGV